MTTTTTLADLAANSLNAVRILEQHGLDYCCGGKQPFEEACLAKGIKPESIMREIEESNVATAAGRDWLTAPLDETGRSTFWKPTTPTSKLDLPVLSARIAKVASVHAARDPKVYPRMVQVFAALRAELEMHLYKEETIPVPVHPNRYGRAAARRAGPRLPCLFGSIANPIGMMEREHEGAGGAPGGNPRADHTDFELPSYACSTVRALYEGLQALESDLHVHIHLENNILFPRAIDLEKR